MTGGVSNLKSSNGSAVFSSFFGAVFGFAFVCGRFARVVGKGAVLFRSRDISPQFRWNLGAFSKMSPHPFANSFCRNMHSRHLPA